MKDRLTRKRFAAKKIHTSIYLMPKDRDYVQHIMETRGISMTDVISELIQKDINQKVKAL